MKHISFFLTTRQVRSRSKDVTRRSGWATLTAGTRLRAVVKGQGLKKGERTESLGLIGVVSVRREPLQRLLDDPAYGRREVDREGFPDFSVERFISMFLASHKGCTRSSPLQRIEFIYLHEPTGEGPR